MYPTLVVKQGDDASGHRQRDLHWPANKALISKEGCDTFWHSVLKSLEQLYFALDLAPPEERGFTTMVSTLNEMDLKEIESQVAEAVEERQPFERIEVSKQQALDLICDNRFKIEIAQDLPADATITVYRCGPLVDLCRGPHVPNTSHVKALACLKVSGCNWKGQVDGDRLQRVYGISYPDKKELKDYLTRLKEAEKRDHRVLGKNDQLFMFHELSLEAHSFCLKGRSSTTD